jgi:tetratricopeptide (TPR) repeat protein
MRALQYLSAGMLLAASIAGAQTAADHIALGDKSYVGMDAPAALQHYQEAIKLDPKNYEALWKASRSAVDLGSYERDDEKRGLDFKNAEAYARSAVEVNPGDAEGHFNLARSSGKTRLPRDQRRESSTPRTSACRPSSA